MLRAMLEVSQTATAPISGKARVQSIDTLRGVALLGILIINILAFAQPFGSLGDPTVDGATEGVNFALFAGADIFVEGGMRALFSMLFGAGLLIFMNKPGADAGEVKALYYRRTGLLILFGLFNAYALLWVGDILYLYGMTGLLLFLFRNLSARGLLLWSIGVLLLTTLIHSGLHFSLRQLGEVVAEARTLPPGVEMTEQQQQAVQGWEIMLEGQGLSEEGRIEEIAARKAGYVENLRFVAGLAFYMQTVGLLVLGLWDALGMMLLGMALMKWRVFNASHSLRFYLLMMLVGFGVGIPLNWWETMTFVDSGYQLHWQSFNRPTYDLGRLSLAVGYIGLVMAICRAGVLPMVQAALAKVGQMALTNYLMQSVLCNFVFLGIGLGLFSEWDRQRMYLFVLGVWLFQIVFSHFWLNRYRFGPCEWLWRSLTYRRRQPMLAESGKAG